MPYRGPDNGRMQAQQGADIFRYGGYAVTWRRVAGTAAALSNAAGLGAKPLYAEQTITALFGPVAQPEGQTPAGMFAASEFAMTTREAVGRTDEIVWAGVLYRVDSVPVQEPLTSAWNCVITRGK